MGKRKHKKDRRDHIKHKIKRLEKKLRRCETSSDGGASEYSEEDRGRSETWDEYEVNSYRSSVEVSPDVRSTVVVPDPAIKLGADCTAPATTADKTKTSASADVQPPSAAGNVDATATTSNEPPPTAPVPLPADILGALGDPKKKSEVFGPKIQEEISQRWGRILSEGLDKDQKRGILDKTLVPENFTLVKAPKLNPEVSAILNESARNRDKRLEKAQHHLGLGIAGLTNVISTLIDGEMNKIDMIKKLSEINQIFLDLHYENTVNRRKLIGTSLDSKFHNIVQDVTRDSFLYGEGLGEKIKASKTAEKSGLQVKRADHHPPSSSSKKQSSHQGNWKGPSRQSHRGARHGGNKTRPYYYQTSSRRTTQPPDRFQSSSKTAAKPTAAAKNQ